MDPSDHGNNSDTNLNLRDIEDLERASKVVGDIRRLINAEFDLPEQSRFRRSVETLGNVLKITSGFLLRRQFEVPEVDVNFSAVQLQADAPRNDGEIVTVDLVSPGTREYLQPPEDLRFTGEFDLCDLFTSPVRNGPHSQASENKAFQSIFSSPEDNADETQAHFGDFQPPKEISDLEEIADYWSSDHEESVVGKINEVNEDTDSEADGEIPQIASDVASVKIGAGAEEATENSNTDLDESEESDTEAELPENTAETNITLRRIPAKEPEAVGTEAGLSTSGLSGKKKKQTDVPTEPQQRYSLRSKSAK